MNDAHTNLCDPGLVEFTLAAPCCEGFGCRLAAPAPPRDVAPIVPHWVATMAHPLRSTAPLRLVPPGGAHVPNEPSAPLAPSVADPQYAARVRLALYAADVGAWDYDLLAGAVWWDPRCGAILGADPTGVRTYADLLALVHPDDRAALTASWQPYLDPAREGLCYEHVFRTTAGSDGDDYWTRRDRHVAIRGRMLFETIDGFRRATRLLGTVRDVTAECEREAERERLLAAECAARHEAERVRFALEAAGRITEAALRAAPAAEVLREVLEHVRAGLHADRATVLLADPAGTTVGVELPRHAGLDPAAERQAGVVGRIEAGIALPVPAEEAPSLLDVPLVSAGRLVGLLEVGRDTADPFTDDDRALLAFVAERVAAVVVRAQLDETSESARREAEQARLRAEAAITVRSQFLVALGREFRTALDSVGGHAELVALGVHGPVTTKQVDALRRIQRNQRHLVGLVTAALQHIRPDLPGLRESGGWDAAAPVLEPAQRTP